MSELLSRTVRIKRRLIDRLMGFKCLYQTKLTDGQRVAYGTGATRKTSQQCAQRNWDARFAEDRMGAWLGHDREFREAVALVKRYLRDRGYKIGGSSEAQQQKGEGTALAPSPVLESLVEGGG